MHIVRIHIYPAGWLLVKFERSVAIPSRITIRIVSIKQIMSTSLCKKVQKSTYSLINYFLWRVLFSVSQCLYIGELGSNLNLLVLFSYQFLKIRQSVPTA